MFIISNAIKAVRVFTRFLGCEEIGKSFKFPRIDRPILITKNKSELQKFYNEGFSNLGDRALFLVFATSGLRHHEATELTPKDVNLDRVWLFRIMNKQLLGEQKILL